MIARMTKEGVITLEPQNGAEAVALKAWQKDNVVDAHGVEVGNGGCFIKARAIEVVVKD